MNLYTQKKRWKIWLFVSAVIAFVAILYYSNLLLNDIASEERKKVTLWAEAVKHKAELVNSTTEFFDEIRIEEAKRCAADFISQMAFVSPTYKSADQTEKREKNPIKIIRSCMEHVDNGEVEDIDTFEEELTEN